MSISFISRKVAKFALRRQDLASFVLNLASWRDIIPGIHADSPRVRWDSRTIAAFDFFRRALYVLVSISFISRKVAKFAQSRQDLASFVLNLASWRDIIPGIHADSREFAGTPGPLRLLIFFVAPCTVLFPSALFQDNSPSLRLGVKISRLLFGTYPHFFKSFQEFTQTRK